MPTELLDASIWAFPTENPDRLAIDYTLTFKLDSVSPEDVVQREDQRGIVHGSGYFHPKGSNLTDHYIQRIILKSRGSRYYREFKDHDDSFAIPRPLRWD